MKKSINGWTFEAGLPVARAARRAAAAGFEAFEPVAYASGPLTVDGDERSWREAGDAIRGAGLDVASLACGLFWRWNYTSPDAADRTKAMELTTVLVQRAAWLGAPAVLVVPGCVGERMDARPRTTYAQALVHAASALTELASTAEQHGVFLAIENVCNKFLLSPVEMRELLDRVNSAWVGAYLDVGNAMAFGYPQDWIETLGPRIVRVHVKDFRLDAGETGGFCPLGEGDVDWAAVMTALRRIGYDGPLTYEGKGEPADIAERMGKLGIGDQGSGIRGWCE